MKHKRPTYPVNVKIPQLYVGKIDENLKEGGVLRKARFEGRAHFVREAVKEKLMQLGLLSQEEQRKLEDMRGRRGRRKRR